MGGLRLGPAKGCPRGDRRGAVRRVGRSTGLFRSGSGLRIAELPAELERSGRFSRRGGGVGAASCPGGGPEFTGGLVRVRARRRAERASVATGVGRSAWVGFPSGASPDL